MTERQEAFPARVRGISHPCRGKRLCEKRARQFSRPLRFTCNCRCPRRARPPRRPWSWRTRPGARRVLYESPRTPRIAMTHTAAPRKDFVREMVAEDVATNRFGRPPKTRFPPEPNGFPHIGHVKSICLNFGLAREFGGRVHLRFDDTNPLTEDMKYVEAMKADVRWLGFEWDAELYASDYFERLYEFAERLVTKGKAYVDSQSEEQIREGRGTVTTPGTDSPFRERTPEENLDLLRRMKAGEFP